jgi:hypothetical protein
MAAIFITFNTGESNMCGSIDSTKAVYGSEQFTFTPRPTSKREKAGFIRFKGVTISGWRSFSGWFYAEGKNAPVLWNNVASV